MSYFKKAYDKYNNHPLFKGCITISCPIGWLSYLDNIVSNIEAYNLKNPHQKTTISQVKTKFGRLTVYISRESDHSDGFVSQELLKSIDLLINKASDSCCICGKELTETVENSNLVWKCMDHYEYTQSKKHKRVINEQI